MVTLDVAIVNVALPSVQADLGVAQADLQWVVITYGIMLGGLLLLGGRAGDLFGRRRMLLAGLSLFTVASLTAGLADSFGQLVASRAVQGAGAALTAPAALAILVGTFREGTARNKALGLFGAAGGSSASVGVVLSGALTAGPGWEWIFFINIPIGIAMVGHDQPDHSRGVEDLVAWQNWPLDRTHPVIRSSCAVTDLPQGALVFLQVVTCPA